MAGPRPFVGSCCEKCLPASRKALVNETILTSETNNMLIVPTMKEHNNYFVRWFHYFFFIFCGKSPYYYPNVSDEIPYHQTVVSAVQRAAKEDSGGCDVRSETYSKLLQKHANRAKYVLKRMAANFNIFFLRLLIWLMYTVTSKVMTSIQLHKGQLDMLKRANDSPYPLIFLPTHRSHLDYFLVSCVTLTNKIRNPLIASGENLRLPLIGHILNGAGAFYIKRKLDPKEGKKDHVYRAVLHTYMEKILAAGHSLEFFMEGGRSRSGKTIIPKAGLMSIVMQTLLDGKIEDAYLVPITINYDKVMDGNFVSEQLGSPKVKESFWATMKALSQLGKTNFGSARIDIAQPFSLKEFVQSAQKYSLPSNLPPSSSPNLLIPHQDVRRLSSNASLDGTDVVVEDLRQLVQDLAEHVSYDQSHFITMMSTNLVAFLLLTKYRQGATFQQVVDGFSWLRKELLIRGRDVGFTDDSATCVESAVNILGPNLVTSTTSKSSGDVNSARRTVVLKASTELPNVVEVSYYSNAIVPVFLMESVIANALFAILDERLVSLRDCDDSKLTVSRKQLVEKAETLCGILQFEFIFVPPCMNLTRAIHDVVEKLITNGLLSTVGDPVVSNTDDKPKRTWANPFAKKLSVDSESEVENKDFKDDQLKINVTEENAEHLEFLSNVLSPFIESYWLAARNLTCLVGTQMKESEFLKHARQSVHTRIASGLILYNESVCGDSLGNAIKLFENWKIVKSRSEGKGRHFFLTNDYNREDKIADIVDTIEVFKKLKRTQLKDE